MLPLQGARSVLQEFECNVGRLAGRAREKRVPETAECEIKRPSEAIGWVIHCDPVHLGGVCSGMGSLTTECCLLALFLGQGERL